jgi:hypothetical protein
MIANTRMNCIRKIDGGRPMGERYQIPFGSKAKDLVLEHLELGMFQKFLRPFCCLQNIQKPPQPTILISIMSYSLLILPMSRHTQFSNLFHLFRPDLNFNAVLRGANHRCMNGLVAILLWV